MTKKFDAALRRITEDEFGGFYSGALTNDLTLKTSGRIGELSPEVGDMVQVQIVGNLDPAEIDKENSSNTYRISARKGDRITLVFSDMIHNDEVETFRNPTGSLDSTYLNGKPVGTLENKRPSTIVLDLAKLGRNTFNYMHDNIWTACIVLDPEPRRTTMKPETKHTA